LLTSRRQIFLYQEPSLDKEQSANVFKTLVSWAEKFLRHYPSDWVGFTLFTGHEGP
jgi:hypothetical protein